MIAIKRILAALVVVVAAHALGHAIGCAPAMKNLDAINDPNEDAALKRCRDLARAVKADGGASSEAFEAYYRCTQDAGLR